MITCKNYEIKTLLNNEHFHPDLFKDVLFDIEVHGTDECVVECDGIDSLGYSVKVVFADVSICACWAGLMIIQLKDGTFIKFIKHDKEKSEDD